MRIEEQLGAYEALLEMALDWLRGIEQEAQRGGGKGGADLAYIFHTAGMHKDITRRLAKLKEDK